MLCSVESRSISPVFVGRAEESSTLLAALARAATGEPQVLVVGGEAGVGKTRLLEEFLAAACEQDATVAVGGCLELGAEGLPFAPFATALRTLHRKLGDEMTAAAAGREAELARLLPELGSAGRDVHDQEGRARLFELTVRLLERLAGERTIVLALEDLHWADRSTRELLGYLVRSVQSARLVVLATYRSDDVHRRHPLRPFLAELDRLRSVQRIELPRLVEDEVRAQLAGIRGVPEPDHGLVQEIFERSEGNPFFVEELALSGGDGRLSESLRDLLLVRIEELPETAQRVVRVAARTTTVEHTLLAAVSGLGEDELIEGLRAAVGANVLVPAAPDEDGDGYRFRHALLREAVIDDLLPGERTRLSRRYAEALEADPGLVRPEERVTRLASYWYYARDAAKALPAVVQAIEETRERHAYAEELKLLERAMELWDEVDEATRLALPHMGSLESYPPCGCGPEKSHPEFLDLLAEAAAAARVDGMREQGLSFVKKALKLIDPAKDPKRAAWFWMERSRLTAGSGRGNGWAELAEALKLVEDQPPSPVQADVLSNAANWLVLHGWDDRTVEMTERAVEVAREVGALEVELNARVTLATMRAERNEEDGWLAELFETREQAGRIGAPRLLMRIHASVTDQLEKYGRSAEAVEAGREGIDELRRRGLYDAAAFLAGNVAESLITLGQWPQADEVIQEWSRYAGGSRARAAMVKNAATLALLRGQHEESRRLLTTARAHMGKNDGEPQYELPLIFSEIACAAAHGETAEAAAMLRRGFEMLPLPGQAPYVAQFLLAGAEFLADAAGLPGVAAQEHAALLDRLAKEADRLTQKQVRRPAMVLHIQAELARARGADDPALWARTAAGLEPYAFAYQRARVRHRWAAALLAAGGDGARDQAAELLTAAHSAAEDLTAEPLRAEIERLAGRARIALGGDGGETPADAVESLGLTAREQDVLRLVAAGRSNRQIAEELFISPKTASVHVSNMMAKLGVAGRGEAAAVAHKLRLFERAEPV
ncbi:AAA family ATPase [Streptomyces sp. A7024]|uniref:AAA family ATPase n=1 Tax=Streptomyces coryli TaxID=1128680 RepID=A0A6G4TW69_9ACTN|nr:helix-turn-helix transcriptional regulator [Streptomyces coryli]NGN64022.1 AAA family ATPase [Streptomyces coryli]